MSKLIHTLVAPFFISLLSVSCTTIDYRSVQAEFEDAARGDNLVSAAKPNQNEILTGTNYSAVLAKLSDGNIGDLDATLKPNAWMLRSICEWRTGQFDQALNSSQKGLSAKPAANSRDEVILTLLPALVIDSEIHRDWRASSKSFSEAEYQEKAKANYVTALDTIAQAEARYGAATPASTKYYCSYQKWRLIANWWEVITSVSSDSTVLRRLRSEAASHLDGNKTPVAAAAAARDAIPSSHPLHQLIVAQSNR